MNIKAQCKFLYKKYLSKEKYNERLQMVNFQSSIIKQCCDLLKEEKILTTKINDKIAIIKRKSKELIDLQFESDEIRNRNFFDEEIYEIIKKDILTTKKQYHSILDDMIELFKEKDVINEKILKLEYDFRNSEQQYIEHYKKYGN